MGVMPDRMGPIRPTDPATPPAPAGRLCRVCGVLLDPTVVEDGVHGPCADRVLRISQPDIDLALEHPMRTELVRIIRMADSGSSRSRQVAIGPSEIGGSCDRRLAMRMAGVNAVNRSSDPWPAIVGTGIHLWLQQALGHENQAHLRAGESAPWVTETRVEVDPVIRGSSDAYHVPTATVVDWKSMGETTEAKLVKGGPSDAYWTQLHSYGLGFVRAGMPVRKVGLMFLRREGYLRKARYYEQDFRPDIAHRAVGRVYQVARGVLALQQQYGPEMWDRVPADVSGLCGYCPFFRREAGQASSSGCPGR
jgi:hypothetical protein